MATTRIGTLREEFDQGRNFEVVKPFKFSGTMYGPGQPFDKTLVNARRLRQLYDGRHLRMMTKVVQPSKEEYPRSLVEIGNMVPKKVPRVQLSE